MWMQRQERPLVGQRGMRLIFVDVYLLPTALIHPLLSQTEVFPGEHRYVRVFSIEPDPERSISSHCHGKLLNQPAHVLSSRKGDAKQVLAHLHEESGIRRIRPRRELL
jgi:hypothetical protein